MKLKEVCDRTGLSKKTVRLYEEKQLIAPEIQWRNGRNYREYSEEDVATLREIAVLRKSLFSMEEIYTMQQDPEEIETVLQNYATRIKDLYEHLKYLNHTLDQIEPHMIQNISQLAQEMSGAAGQLPFPAYDLNPKFRYLDAIEDAPRHVVPQENLDEIVPSKQVFNQMVIGRMKGGGLLISANQLTATRKARQGEGWVPTWEHIPEDPAWLIIVIKPLSGAMFLLILYFVWNWLAPYDIYNHDFSHLRLPFLIFLVILIGRIAIALYQYRQRQKTWLNKHGNH